MSGFYKKAVVWLGLNEEYPDDEFDQAPEPSNGAPSGHVASPAPTPNPRPAPESSAQRPVGPQPEARPNPTPAVREVEAPGRYGGRTGGETSTVRALPMDEEPSSAVTGSPSSKRTTGRDLSGATVRAVPMAITIKPQVVVPKSFNDAQDVADMYRDNKPVIVNMQNAERDLARRLIDFSSGLCYGLGGQMEKVAKDVYLLTPDDVEVADEHRVVPQS